MRRRLRRIFGADQLLRRSSAGLGVSDLRSAILLATGFPGDGVGVLPSEAMAIPLATALLGLGHGVPFSAFVNRFLSFCFESFCFIFL